MHAISQVAGMSYNSTDISHPICTDSKLSRFFDQLNGRLDAMQNDTEAWRNATQTDTEAWRNATRNDTEAWRSKNSAELKEIRTDGKATRAEVTRLVQRPNEAAAAARRWDSRLLSLTSNRFLDRPGDVFVNSVSRGLLLAG